MRRTKIICTIGPATNSHKMIKELAKAGMDIARLNFAYGSHREFQEIIKSIRRVSAELDKPIGILQDLSGPKIKIGCLKNEPLILKEGFVITLSTQEIVGDQNIISVSYKSLHKEVKAGEILYLNEGRIKLKVIRTELGSIVCQVLIGGELRGGKGINFPQTRLPLPAFTDKDNEDLAFGLKEGVDMISLSFVKQAREIHDVRKIIKKSGTDVMLISKIEKWEAVENIDEIIKASDGIMLYRGDLGVEASLSKIPLIQKTIIYKANLFGRPIITATQMLESMIESKIPARIEVTDIANAILDMSDAVMLSEETAIGQNPVECVQVMDSIAQEAESAFEYESMLRDKVDLRQLTISDAMSYTICQMAIDIKAQAIIACTLSGLTAQMISKYRPAVPIIAVSPKIETVRQLSLYWGVYPFKINERTNTTIDEIIIKSIELANTNGFVKSGDKIIIAGSGLSVDIAETTNFLKVVVV